MFLNPSGVCSKGLDKVELHRKKGVNKLYVFHC